MGKKSIFPQIIAAVLIFALVLTAAWMAGRYSWKLFGFSACSWAGIEDVQVQEDSVRIVGFYPGSFPSGFLGYHAEQSDGTLYVGFRFSGWFGIFETGDFDITIPMDEQITRVVLKDADSERVIWERPQRFETAPEVIAAVYPNQDFSELLAEDGIIQVEAWYDEWEMMNVSVASDHSRVELGSFGRLVESYAFRRQDGRSFVMVTCDYMSDDFVTFLCEVTGGDVRLCSVLDCAYPAETPTSTQVFPMIVSLDVLGSYRARMEYDLDEEGNLLQAWEVFVIDRNHPMTLLRDIPVTVDGVQITLEQGTQIVVTGTDDAGEVYFRVPGTDMIGTIHYTLEDEYGWIHLIDGISEYECFDSLPYAG